MTLPIKNTARHYGLIARMLHWSSVGLLVVVIYTSGLFENMNRGDVRQDLVRLHSSYGIVFLVLMITRFSWRWLNINPVNSYNIHPMQKLSALLLHRTIYLVFILQCFFGLAILVFAGDPIYLFDFEISSFISGSVCLNEFSVYLHDLVSVLIYPLLGLHILAAIYHQIFGVLDE